MSKVLKITKENTKEDGYRTRIYTGEVDLTAQFEGSIEIDEGLGWVRFEKHLSATGYILAKAGTGIEAREGIKARVGIKAGWGIRAGTGIKAGEGIEAREGIEAGWGIRAGTYIEAGEGIKARWGITAGEGIEAGTGIKAGEGIEAGWGIEAGLWVKCKKALSFRYRLFAGTATWKETVTDDEQLVECGRLKRGTVVTGVLREVGLAGDSEAAITEALER